jgi:hypothetical protein
MVVGLERNSMGRHKDKQEDCRAQWNLAIFNRIDELRVLVGSK